MPVSPHVRLELAAAFVPGDPLVLGAVLLGPARHAGGGGHLCDRDGGVEGQGRLGMAGHQQVPWLLGCELHWVATSTAAAGAEWEDRQKALLEDLSA